MSIIWITFIITAALLAGVALRYKGAQASVLHSV